MQIVPKEAPEPRHHVRRLTEALRSLKPDKDHAITVDIPTMKALRVYARSKGWIVTQQTQQDGSILFWRLG